MSAEATICQECGMVCTSPTEYHPFAACLMFKGCHDGDKVRANLQAVQQHATDRLRAEVEGLRAAIDAHNADCLQQCESRKEAGPSHCPMRGYDRECGDCPRDGMLNLSGPKGQGSGDA